MLASFEFVVLENFNIHAKTTLSGMAQNLPSSMTNMGLSQMVFGSLYVTGDILNLVFDAGGLVVKERSVVLLSWSHYLQVRF